MHRYICINTCYVHVCVYIYRYVIHIDTQLQSTKPLLVDQLHTMATAETSCYPKHARDTSASPARQHVRSHFTADAESLSYRKASGNLKHASDGKGT